MRDIVNKATVQAPTITGLIQLACLASDDSVHLRTHLQLFVSALLAAVPLNMRGDRGCLFTHDTADDCWDTERDNDGEYRVRRD